MIDAVILAGAPNNGPMREVSDAPNEALIQVNGRTILSYVVDALRGSGCIGRIVVVGPPDLLKPGLPDGVDCVSDEGSLIGNLMKGLSSLPGSDLAMVATSDIPFLTPEAVRDFHERCRASQADVYYPVVERAVAERSYPGVQRTYAKLVDGEFTGGNMVILRPAKLLAQRATIEEAIALRKKPLRLARMLGLGFIVKFLVRRLTVGEIEKRVGTMLSLTGKCVVTPYAEVGVDVDKPSDLELAERVLA